MSEHQENNTNNRAITAHLEKSENFQDDVGVEQQQQSKTTFESNGINETITSSTAVPSTLNESGTDLTTGSNSTIKVGSINRISPPLQNDSIVDAIIDENDTDVQLLIESISKYGSYIDKIQQKVFPNKSILCITKMIQSIRDYRLQSKALWTNDEIQRLTQSLQVNKYNTKPSASHHTAAALPTFVAENSDSQNTNNCTSVAFGRSNDRNNTYSPTTIFYDNTAIMESIQNAVGTRHLQQIHEHLQALDQQQSNSYHRQEQCEPLEKDAIDEGTKTSTNEINNIDIQVEADILKNRIIINGRSSNKADKIAATETTSTISSKANHIPSLASTRHQSSSSSSTVAHDSKRASDNNNQKRVQIETNEKLLYSTTTVGDETNKSTSEPLSLMKTLKSRRKTFDEDGVDYTIETKHDRNNVTNYKKNDFDNQNNGLINESIQTVKEDSGVDMIKSARTDRNNAGHERRQKLEKVTNSITDNNEKMEIDKISSTTTTSVALESDCATNDVENVENVTNPWKQRSKLTDGNNMIDNEKSGETFRKIATIIDETVPAKDGHKNKVDTSKTKRVQRTHGLKGKKLQTDVIGNNPTNGAISVAVPALISASYVTDENEAKPMASLFHEDSSISERAKEVDETIDGQKTKDEHYTFTEAEEQIPTTITKKNRGRDKTCTSTDAPYVATSVRSRRPSIKPDRYVDKREKTDAPYFATDVRSRRPSIKPDRYIDKSEKPIPRRKPRIELQKHKLDVDVEMMMNTDSSQDSDDSDEFPGANDITAPRGVESSLIEVDGAPHCPKHDENGDKFVATSPSRTGKWKRDEIYRLNVGIALYGTTDISILFDLVQSRNEAQIQKFIRANQKKCNILLRKSIPAVDLSMSDKEIEALIINELRTVQSADDSTPMYETSVPNTDQTIASKYSNGFSDINNTDLLTSRKRSPRKGSSGIDGWSSREIELLNIGIARFGRADFVSILDLVDTKTEKQIRKLFRHAESRNTPIILHDMIPGIEENEFDEVLQIIAKEIDNQRNNCLNEVVIKDTTFCDKMNQNSTQDPVDLEISNKGRSNKKGIEHSYKSRWSNSEIFLLNKGIAVNGFQNIQRLESIVATRSVNEIVKKLLKESSRSFSLVLLSGPIADAKIDDDNLGQKIEDALVIQKANPSQISVAREAIVDAINQQSLSCILDPTNAETSTIELNDNTQTGGTQISDVSAKSKLEISKKRKRKNSGEIVKRKQFRHIKDSQPLSAITETDGNHEESNDDIPISEWIKKSAAVDISKGESSRGLNRGSWSADEIALLNRAIALHGRNDLKALEEIVRSRNVHQIKFFLRYVSKEDTPIVLLDDAITDGTDEVEDLEARIEEICEMKRLIQREYLHTDDEVDYELRTGNWSSDEVARLNRAIAVHGREDVDVLQNIVKSRTIEQIRGMFSNVRRNKTNVKLLEKAVDFADDLTTDLDQRIREYLHTDDEVDYELRTGVWSSDEVTRLNRAIAVHGREDVDVLQNIVKSRTISQINAMFNNVRRNTTNVKLLDKSLDFAGDLTTDLDQRIQDMLAMSASRHILQRTKAKEASIKISQNALLESRDGNGSDSNNAAENLKVIGSMGRRSRTLESRRNTDRKSTTRSASPLDLEEKKDDGVPEPNVEFCQFISLGDKYVSEEATISPNEQFQNFVGNVVEAYLQDSPISQHAIIRFLLSKYVALGLADPEMSEDQVKRKIMSIVEDTVHLYRIGNARPAKKIVTEYIEALSEIEEKKKKDIQELSYTISMPTFIEELSYHYYAGRSIEDKLVPLPHAPPLPVLPSERWTFDDSSRVLLVNFQDCDDIPNDEKRFLAQMMQRDDVTVIVEGLLNSLDPMKWSISSFENAFAGKPYHKFRRFNKRKSDSGHISFTEQDKFVSMKIGDYATYLHLLQEGTEVPFSYLDADGIEQEVPNVSDVVFYMIDVDMAKFLPMQDKDYKNSIKIPELLPGGGWCMMNNLPDSARPFMGPNCYLTPGGGYTQMHQDGHGTVDSGHSVLSGYNEVVMLRRIPECHKLNACKIIPSLRRCRTELEAHATLYKLPHDDGRMESLEWPTTDTISEWQRMNYYPSVFILKPGQHLHINKGRLHAFRKLTVNELPTNDCHFQLRKLLIQQENLQISPICLSVAFDWMYWGYDREGINREVSSTLECAALCRDNQCKSLAIPETALLVSAMLLADRKDMEVKSISFLSSYTTATKRSQLCIDPMEILPGIMPSLRYIQNRDKKAVEPNATEKRDAIYTGIRLKLSAKPDAFHDPLTYPTDPYGCDYFCNICNQELSNSYFHCNGCEVILNRDFNICSQCYSEERYLKKIQTHPTSNKWYSDVNHVGDTRNSLKSRGCPCHAGLCRTCEGSYCKQCSCKCHKVFLNNFRFIDGASVERILQKCEAKVLDSEVKYSQETEARLHRRPF